MALQVGEAASSKFDAGEVPDRIKAIVEQLRAEGLHAAETALCRELEERYPGIRQRAPTAEAPASRASSQVLPSAASDIGEVRLLPAVSSLRGASPVDRAHDSGRGKSGPSPRRTGTSPTLANATLVPVSPATSLTTGGESSVDEYTGDDDPGYWRIDISDDKAIFDDWTELSRDPSRDERYLREATRLALRPPPVPLSAHGEGGGSAAPPLPAHIRVTAQHLPRA
ncbi:hypothetical protein H632_c184p2, partial [Helicosporidium sp. ATCC 50920]